MPVLSETTHPPIPKTTPENKDERGANLSERVAKPSTVFEEVWLTMDEAVTHCEAAGLSRTAKTIRKWAERSFNIPEGEVVSRREDTLWGQYRWKIEKSSLERKVAEELSREKDAAREQVQTGANFQQPEASKISGAATSKLSEGVQTGSKSAGENEASIARPNVFEPDDLNATDARTAPNTEPPHLSGPC